MSITRSATRWTHARLSRRSQGQGARDDAAAAALLRDARLRTANKAGAARLPVRVNGLRGDRLG